MHTTTKLTLALVTVALVATAAVAQPNRAPRAGGPGGPGGWDADGPGWRLEHLAEVLDLTDDQKAAIEKLHEDAREQAVDLRKELARLRNQRQGEMLKDAPAEKTLVELTEKMGEVRTELQVLRLKTRLAVREQLTAEQRDQMLLMGPRHGRGGRHGGWGRGCDGPCDGAGRGDWHGGRRGHGRGAGQGPGRDL